MPAVLRTDAAVLIPEEISKEIIAQAASKSAAQKLLKTVPMSSKTTRLPVLSALASAAFVNPSDTGLGKVSKVSWEGKYLNAEPISVIIPVPRDVVADSSFDLFGTAKTEGGAAIARALDAAVFFSTGKPTSWSNGLATQAVAKSKTYVRGTTTKANGGIAEDLNQLLGIVEGDGFDPTGFVARRAFRKYVRGARDTQGQRLLETSASGDMIDGLGLNYLSGFWPDAAPSGVELITGDWSMAVLGVRSDITVQVLDQASIYNPDGTLMYALAQQNMVAIQMIARYAYEVANPVTTEQADSSARFPFACLLAPAS